MKISCDVYKSLQKENYYLYVNAEDGLSRVPEALQAQLGAMEKALSFELTPARKLARVDAAQVLANLQSEGYHLQLPPPFGGLHD